MNTDDNQSAIPENKLFNKNYHKMVRLEGHEIDFIVNDVFHSKINDEETVFDGVSVDFMIEDMSAAIKSNTSKYNAMPATVIVSQKKLSASDIQSIVNAKGDTDPQPLMIPSLAPPRAKDTATPLKSNPMPGQDESKNNTAPIDFIASNDDFVKKTSPRYTIDDVFVDPPAKRQIMSALIMASHHHKLFEEWGLKKMLKGGRALCLNFYGPPGTGKSMMAEAIASHLKRDVYNVNYSELESSSPGESAKNIVKVFNLARDANAVLIFDEADSMLGKRLTNVSSAADYGINVTRSVMLIEIERFYGVIIFTTNFISNYDIAFKRRILASIEFRLPDEKGRAQIWNTHIPRELPLSKDITPTALALKFGGTTGADIKDIVLFASVNCLDKKRDMLIWEDFDNAYQTIRNRYAVI